MGKRRETLSQETEQVQNELLDELVNNDVKQEETSEDNINNNINEQNDIPEVTSGLSQVVPGSEKKYEVGAKVKIKPEIGRDMLGRRIHNGIKNYVYTIKVVRPDGFCTIECLTYQFTLSTKELDLQ